MSKYSAIHPAAAVLLIDKTLRQDHSALELASQLQADHNTDDMADGILYNRKTKDYSKISDRTHRFQEILNGDMKSSIRMVITSRPFSLATPVEVTQLWLNCARNARRSHWNMSEVWLSTNLRNSLDPSTTKMRADGISICTNFCAGPAPIGSS